MANNHRSIIRLEASWFFFSVNWCSLSLNTRRENSLGPKDPRRWWRHKTFGSLKQRRRRRQRERQKSDRFRQAKTTTLHERHAFLYLSLPSLHDYDAKLNNFKFCGQREHKTTTLFFSELLYRPLEFNSRKIRQNLTNWTRLNTR